MKVLIVDDSMLVRSMLRSLFTQDGRYEVAGEAGNGKAAIEAVKQYNPDLVMMDINMPGINGLEATKILMKEHPVPIIIFTSEDISKISFEALSNGAIELIPKPGIDKLNNEQWQEEFLKIIGHAIKFKAFTHNYNKPKSSEKHQDHANRIPKYKILAIGASTGGPSAVRTVISQLPADFPIPVILTQHIEIGFDGGYAEWLNESAALEVRLAKDAEKLKAGTIYVAPATRHLICDTEYVYLDDGPRVDNQKPSVDKMFFSASKAFGSKTMAVLLTGMGYDGAKGCKSIVENRGFTFVQDKTTSLIFGMPKAAIELDAASAILPLDKMASEIERELY